jgi:hypothetical protein
MLPRNKVPIRTDIIIMVRPAFLVEGARKEGTPLLIASIPVTAVHPVENVRITKRVVRGAIGCGAVVVNETGPVIARRTPPYAIMGK